MPETLSFEAQAETMARLRLYADAYGQGAAGRSPAPGGAHEENVRRYWREAITAYFAGNQTIRASRSEQGNSLYLHRLELTDAMRCGVLAFLGAHFDWPLEQALLEVKRCAEMGVHRGKDVSSVHRPWLLVLLVILAFCLVAVGVNRYWPGVAATLWLLYLAGAIFMLTGAENAALRRRLRLGGDPTGILEDWCDIYAAGMFRNAGRTKMAVLLAVLAGLGVGTYLAFRAGLLK